MINKFSIVFLFIYGCSYAQLSVRNNAFVFVNDQIVFVNDAINLNEANSKIYLRNEAQIIQDSGTIGNSGKTGTIAASVKNNKITLVRNSYPSAMDAVTNIHDPKNVSVITGTLYFWEQNPNINSHYLKYYDGGYATYTINATGTLETYIPTTFNTYIHSFHLIDFTSKLFLRRKIHSNKNA